jgi:hypothetical protein
MVMMAVPIVVIPFVIEPNSVVEARAYPNDSISIIVIIIIIISGFDFNANADLGDFLRGRAFLAVAY